MSDHDYACRFCKHAVSWHNNMHGCTVCTCMATNGEAFPQTYGDLASHPYPANHLVKGYAEYTLTPPVADCGSISRIGLPSMATGRCIGHKDHHSLAHSYRPIPPDGRCLHPHAFENQWCHLRYQHAGVHRFEPVPSDHVNHTAPRKDADMKTAAQIERELQALATQRETLAAREAELLRQQEARAALPTEPDVHSVIKFRVQFDAHSVVYTFIATRTNRNSSAQWFTTGTNPKHKGPLTWDELLDLMRSDVGVKTEATSLEFFLFDDSGKWVR